MTHKPYNYRRGNNITKIAQPYRRFLNKLPFEKRMIVVSVLIGLISLFLPWENIGDVARNAFGATTFIIAIILTPLYLLLLYLCSSITALEIQRRYHWNIRIGSLIFWIGLEMLLLNIITFTIIIASMEISSLIDTRFGITISLIAALGICTGGYLMLSKEGVSQPQENTPISDQNHLF